MIPFFHAFQIAAPAEELRFSPPRRWRFDYAWPQHKIALEVEGGVWTGGRHTTGTGFVRDMEKYNTAALLGWRIFRCQPRDLQRSGIYEMLKSAMVADGQKEKGDAPLTQDAAKPTRGR